MAGRDGLLEATARVRQVREGVTKKLEQYREQYEQMHIRALTAEMEAASTRLKLESVLRDIESYKGAVVDLVDELNSEKIQGTDNESALRTAKEKIVKLKSKLKIEFDKLLNNQKDLRIGVNSFMRCVYEYKNNDISRDDFFCAVDLIFSSLLANDTTAGVSIDGANSSSHVEVVFNSNSLQELVSLPPEQRRKRLEVFIDRLSPDKLFSQTSDKLLSYVFEDSSVAVAVPPPLPAKSKLVKEFAKSKIINDNPPLPPRPYPAKSLKQTPDKTAKVSGKTVTKGSRAATSNNSVMSDSDSDFEGNDEIQRIRSSNRMASNESSNTTATVTTNNGGSNFGKPIVPARPYSVSMKRTNKVAGTGGTKLLRRSKSCDQLNIEDYSLPVDSLESVLPYQPLEAWHKMVSIRDSSVLTGSLPRLNVITEDDAVCYVTPNDFRTFVCQVKEKGEKISHRASTRVMKRVDSLIKSYYSTASDQNDYLRLIGNDDGLSWLKSIKSARESIKRSPSPTKSAKYKPNKRLSYENHRAFRRVPPRTSSQAVIPNHPQPPLSRITSKGSSPNLPAVNGHSPIPSLTSSDTFDDPVYEMNPFDRRTSQLQENHAIVDYSSSPPTASRISTSNKSTFVNVEMRQNDKVTSDSYVRENRPPAALPSMNDLQSDISDNGGSGGNRPPASLPRPNNKPKPLPKPRSLSNRGSELVSIKEHNNDRPSSVVRFPDQIPTYCTLKRNTSLRLVPLISQANSRIPSRPESEEDPGDYSLGTFQFVMDKKKLGSMQGTATVIDNESTAAAATAGTKIPNTKVSSSGSDEESDGYETPPDAAQGYIEPMGPRGGGPGGKDRSYTANLSTGNKVVEKQGYMHKLDPSLKRWTRRWFVLKDKELKYYSKTKSRKPKGVINLETWCKISRHEMTSSFQLATPSRTYHFVADSNTECEEWIKALQTVMRMCQMAAGSSSLQADDIISGWVKLILKSNGTQVIKCWVSIVDQMLHVYHSSNDPQPHHVFSLLNAHVRYGTEIPAPSAVHMPRCPTTALPFSSKDEFTIVIEMGGAGVYLSEDDEECVTVMLSNKEEREVWYYHLLSASSGDTGPELTLTEKLITRLWRAEQKKEFDEHTASLWTNPLLTYTSESFIQESLLSHPSGTQANEALEMFKMVNLFITTPFDSLGLDYHIMTLQQLVSRCLSAAGLRDELYCQVLRQISAIPDRSPGLSKTNILQGWFLLALLIPLFLPTRKIVCWYLKTVLSNTANKTKQQQQVSGVAEAAEMCYQRYLRAEKQGPREKTPSWFELNYLMSGPVHVSRFILSLKLKLPVNLMNDTTQMMEFDSSTEVQEFISQLNQEIGMPDSETTGFALMSDWPGEDDEAGFYLFPSNKLCDVISTWSECLSDLGSTHVHSRYIQLTYRKRLHFRSRRGQESDKEALLLTYQISKDVLNEYYFVGQVDLALDITARMAQIDYGDCDCLTVSDPCQVARDAIRRFCPLKFTKMILPHELEAMVDKLLSKWKGYHGTNRHACSRMLLSLLADNWDLFGSTLFYCTDRYAVLTSVKNGAIWLAVHERGITLLSTNHLVKPIVSYNYKEVATFGGHCDDFMLVVNSRRRTGRSLTTPSLFNAQNQSSVHTEKIILSMSKLKIREATYLMASYLDSFNTDS